MTILGQELSLDLGIKCSLLYLWYLLLYMLLTHCLVDFTILNLTFGSGNCFAIYLSLLVSFPFFTPSLQIRVYLKKFLNHTKKRKNFQCRNLKMYKKAKCANTATYTNHTEPTTVKYAIYAWTNGTTIVYSMVNA